MIKNKNRPLQDLTRVPAFSGALLVFFAALGFLVENSGLRTSAHSILHMTILWLTVHQWINDGLMAIFFFLVGLELKRELLEGAISKFSDAILPSIAALGGMIGPAIIYLLLTHDSPELSRGWAISSATDIAFALGVLGVVGSKLPSSLKIFLITLAVLDDLGAVLIIALFYTATIEWNAVLASLAVMGILYFFNRHNISSRLAFVILGSLLWFFVFRSGIHSTVAGVLTAFFYPLRSEKREVLHEWESSLQPYVVLIILPLFALTNAGVDFSGITFSSVINKLSIGIACGLFFGKQIGIFGLAFIAVRLGIGRKPLGSTWLQMYGVSILAGIGFTMSLFIAGLAFSDVGTQNATRVGVLLGTLASALFGSLVLLLATSRATPNGHRKV